MSIIELKQEVKLFDDSEKKGEQAVSIDKNDKWVEISHNGNTLSMSLNNWLMIRKLMDKLLDES